MQNNYFSFKELTQSSTAKAKGIDNCPTDWTIVLHLFELSQFLSKLREAWGSAISVNSGFRCNKLNKIVGGVSTSVHKIGYAADIYPANGKLKDFKKFLKENLTNFDQCIFYDDFVHIGLYSNKGEQRGQWISKEK